MVIRWTQQREQTMGLVVLDADTCEIVDVYISARSVAARIIMGIAPTANALAY